ncbi:MAG: phosphoribosylanthranilate isomerase [Dehalococcoidia bacterium]
MTLFKICGLRDSSNAILARENGASFLGFVFVHGVRRQITLDVALEILNDYRSEFNPGGPALVGLFANQNVEEVNEIIEACDLDYAQLCGSEPESYWNKVDVDVIKQVKIGVSNTSETINAELEKIYRAGCLPLLDKYEKGSLGGTGLSFDWEMVSEFNLSEKFLLAGGLNPENVIDAIRISHPWGVDVSTGVETEGDKDPQKILSFAEAVKTAGM